MNDLVATKKFSEDIPGGQINKNTSKNANGLETKVNINIFNYNLDVWQNKPWSDPAQNENQDKNISRNSKCAIF